jgi:hypothetical protein
VTSVLPARGLLPARVTWARVESGFHGLAGGEYVGYAERTRDGHFVGFDGRSTPVGRYPTLAAAQRAVETAPAASEPMMSPRAEAGFHLAATISGMVALGAFVAAVLTLPVL